MEETLLPIHRELTVEEKLNWTLVENKKLKMLLSELTAANKKLKARIERDEIQFPSKIYGKEVSGKAYAKLLRKYDDLNKRFWEVIQELNQYKKEERL